MKSYASKELIRDVEHVKEFLGVAEFQCIATYINAGGTISTEIVTRKTANGISSYANRMFSKYGENVNVKVVYLYRGIQVSLTTFSA